MTFVIPPPLREELDRKDDEIERLRARLAEAEALLLEAREELNSWMYYGHGSRTSGFGSAPLCNRIEEVTHE